MKHKTSVRVMTLLMIALLSLLPMATALAATPQQEVNPDLVGLWVSELSEEGETVSISLFDDGSMEGLSEFEGGEDDVVYAGEWADNGDDTVTVTITMAGGEDFGDNGVEIVFDVVADDELNAADTTDFGDDGMSIFFEDSEPLSFADAMDAMADDSSDEADATDEAAMETDVAPGIYVSNNLSSQGSPVAAFVYISEDGSYQSVVGNFDAETAPITQLGSWSVSEEGIVTLTSEQEQVVSAEGAEFVDLDEPQDLEFVLSDGVLEGEVISLYLLDAVEEQMSGFAGMVEEDMSDDDEAAMDDEAASVEVSLYSSPMSELAAGAFSMLVLTSEGNAIFTHSSVDVSEITVESGSWEEDTDGALVVSLTSDADGNDLDEPATIVFETDEDGFLVATNFDADRYGDRIILELTEDE